MSKITLSNLVNLQNETTAVSAINANNAVLTAALDNTISRNGTSPNPMGATLDMNSNQIVNLPSPATANSPARLVDLNSTLVPTPAILSGNNVYTGNNSFTGTTSLTTANIAGGTFSGNFSSGTVANKTIFVGNGTDQTASLQAVITALPATGGEIMIVGNVSVTALDFRNRNHIHLTGPSGFGSTPPSRIIVTAGAIGSTNCAINCNGTLNVGFERIQIQSTNAAFNGMVVQYGVTPETPSGSYFMGINDCSITTTNSTAIALALGTTGIGTFNRMYLAGPGTLLQLNGAGHVFSGCTFQPNGVLYPIQHQAASGMSFIGCVFEPCIDGVGRGWVSSTSTIFNATSFSGCWFGDSTAAGTEWIKAQWGSGLSITGCAIGGGSGTCYGISLGGIVGPDPQEGGVRGVSIMGNFFSGFVGGAGINCYGTIVAKSNPRGVVIGGNSVTNGPLINNSAVAEQLTFLPNSIYGSPLQIGAHMAFLGLPAYANNAAAVAAGLTTGQLYQTTGTEKAIQIV